MISLLMAGMILLNTNLTVLVTYFSPFGVERGVGPGVTVYAVELVDGKETLPPYACPNGTNADSVCVIPNVPSPSLVRVIAVYEDFNPWYYFECEADTLLVEPQEYVEVPCQRVYEWPMWFPHITAPPMAER